MNKQWPDDYHAWTGTFDELVNTTNEVLSGLGLVDQAINPRLMRHYQAEGAVGRGTRSGRSAHFSFTDLASAVASRGLVKEGWSVKNSASLLNMMSASENPLASSSVHSDNTSDEPVHDPVQVVRDLLRGTTVKSNSITPSGNGVKPWGFFANVSMSSPLKSSSLGNSLSSFSGSSSQVIPTLSSEKPDVIPSSTTTTSQVAPGLTLVIDEAVFASSSPAARAAAADALEVWVRRLR